MTLTPELPHGFVARSLSTPAGALAYLERRAMPAHTYLLIHGAGGSARSFAELATRPGPADELDLV